jgi:energy-converting hydrogenase Eha subunit G
MLPKIQSLPVWFALYDLSKLMVCVLCLLGFSGFLCYNELSIIQMKNIVVHDSHVELTLVQSKTDIYWRGIIVVIAKTGNDLCPVTWLKKYVQLADLNSNPEFFICRSLCFLKSQKCINWTQIIVHCPNREQERFYLRL